jgi:hypothetical protein
MPALDSLKDIERFVQRRIRWDWHDDIDVIRVEERRERFFKKTVVVIGCRSQIACEQARISLAAFVANDASDWEASHWRFVKDQDRPDLPFRLDLIEPKPDGYEAVE